jgi:hypothetical protein
VMDGGESGGYMRAGKNGVGEKNKGIQWKQFLAPHFFVLTWFGEANLGGPDLTSEALVRGGQT